MQRNTYIAIGLCLALLVFVFTLESGSGVANNKPSQAVSAVAAQPVAANNPNTDKAMLVTYCELAIKPQLKNPNSFNVDMHTTTVYDNEGNLLLDMFYYAENSYGATGINEVFCEFTKSGTLISITPA